MRHAVLACLLFAGCSFEHGVSPTNTDAPPLDAPDSDAPDGSTECTTYSTIFDTCAAMTGTAEVTLTPGDWTYNTDIHLLTGPVTPMQLSSMVIDAAAGPIDVVFVASLTVEDGAVLRVIGPNFDRPFGVAATGPVRIDGIIDLSANGAGARNDIVCGGLTGSRGENESGGSGGGGGGAFQGAGGAGGDGNKNGEKSDGGPGGTAIPARPASPIGGCDGGHGGTTGFSGPGADGGDGGGAIYIASATSIAIGPTGVIDAGGGGGDGGKGTGNGGGGGGSGGMILIESKDVTVAGTLAANGGGGGEGNMNGMPGENGKPGKARARGGKGGEPEGGDGGDGAADNTLDGAPADDLRDGGGGGGGGGAGFIAIGCPSPDVSAGTISPAYAPWP